MLARADWEYFVEGDGRDVLRPHIRETLEELSRCGRVSLLEGDSQIVPGITRLSAPGHTPGHSIYVVHNGPTGSSCSAMRCIARSSLATWTGRRLQTSIPCSPVGPGKPSSAIWNSMVARPSAAISQS